MEGKRYLRRWWEADIGVPLASAMLAKLSS
jgi:hypothetical protein